MKSVLMAMLFLLACSPFVFAEGNELNAELDEGIYEHCGANREFNGDVVIECWNGDDAGNMSVNARFKKKTLYYLLI
ncbi:hypothetical protein ACFL08_00625 [Patescibacteria group bacterium]